MSTQELISQLRTRPGVLAVHYDEQERVLTLRYDGGRVNVADIEAFARSAGATLRMLPAETRPLTPEEAELAALPWMIRLTALTLATVIAGWVVEDFMALPHWVAWLLYAIAYASGGFYSVQEAWETLKKRQFDVNFLMIVAAVGAAIVGQPREGAILMFLFSLSGTLETYAMGRTHASIRALLDMTPKEAEVYRDGTLVRAPVETLRVGEVVLVRPGAQVPADGVVVRGESALNEARSPASRCRSRNAPARRCSPARSTARGRSRCASPPRRNTRRWRGLCRWCAKRVNKRQRVRILPTG